MHFSDSYLHLKKLKNKTIANHLKKALKTLENEVNNPSFIKCLQQKENLKTPIEDLRKKYDINQLEKVIEGINTVLDDHLPKDDVDPTIPLIRDILTDIRKTAVSQKKFYDFYNNSHFKGIARQYATHYIPFNQGNDPFKGSDFQGYCWGHSHRYGSLASKGILDELSDASDQKLYETFKKNWTFADILFRRVGWFFSVQLEAKIRQAIWRSLQELDDKSILNFNFLINNTGFHSTALRMNGDGIEYYENNYGLVKFSTRENAVNFLAAHLLNEALSAEGEVSFITVYKLPYTNIVEQDVFAEVPQSIIEKEFNYEVEVEKMPHTPDLVDALDALSNHALKLSREKYAKARIKANEIQNLVQELYQLPADKIKERVNSILSNREHSLMINRGTGLYFFASGFKHHSTTETLLSEIQKNCNPDLNSESLHNRK